jgi:phosphopantothenoylcysteine decarboxylase/phosphopantothenate--cysteine ligase
MLKGKKIVVGITGSIAAYKIPFLIRLLVKEEADVRVIMTPAATDFVTPLTLATLTRNVVIIDPFQKNSGEWNNHVELGLWADLMLFAPVTANTLAKMAHGQADNFVITAYLSARCPIFIAPAMDMDMYNHPSTQENISILKSRGHRIIEPQTGELASGLSGPGRLEEPSAIHQAIEDYFSRQNDLSGYRFLITAGPTYEKIDPVRFIGNFSSGKMGFALASEALSRGAYVTLVSGPTGQHLDHPNLSKRDVVSADEMHKATMENAGSADVIIMSAAVADYTVVEPEPDKIKKSGEKLLLELKPTVDILSELGAKKTKNQVLVGFALETRNELANAQSKLISKNLDMIVLNSLRDPGAGFGTDTNKVTILTKDEKIKEGELQSKELVAAEILDVIANEFLYKGQ